MLNYFKIYRCGVEETHARLWFSNKIVEYIHQNYQTQEIFLKQQQLEYFHSVND